MSFEDGLLRVVRQRGNLCRKPVTPRAAAWRPVIGLDEAPTREVCTQAGVTLANLNCPGQIVISGEAEKINAAIELAKAKGARKAIPLVVAAAYHSPLMSSAQPKLQGLVWRK